MVRLIESKLHDLKTCIGEVDRFLFASSIKVDGKDVTLSLVDETVFNTWFVVQTWHDWFARANTAAPFPNRTKANNATMYRIMAKGGDSHLPVASVVETLRGFRQRDIGKWERLEAEKDLKLMKDFAQKMVRPLCVNHSMLSLDESGIKHFTCTKVENNELPWFKRDGD